MRILNVLIVLALLSPTVFRAVAGGAMSFSEFLQVTEANDDSLVVTVGGIEKPLRFTRVD